ncbi:putative quinic acid utilization activator [Diaporthe ampelina]|uniref:Putative quinic acid utilization activator n=1 Tax=Diaporthe ampelina TaxID=1214573 RepID=A0A0G2FJA4_9PEZI|nr:putative quinic acid utilization activator [Diaporthe ampelina]
MSDFDDLRDDADAPAAHPGEADPAVSVGGDSTAAAPVNPRKRKKSSRACDFCHVNHQPCDNAKPRCGYCERHNKSCLYLRPQKKRGPAQGYRSALHTLRESAAAWGAALNLIPSLGPVVEGYLKQPEGKRLVKAIRDPAQQEFFIQAWQQSGSLGFAPNETLEDFLDMSFNPEPLEQPPEQDPFLGSEQDQKAYYELLMGKRFG